MKTRRTATRPPTGPMTRNPGNPVQRDGDGIDRITFGSVGEAVRDSMLDYAQNETNLTFIRTNLKDHLSGKDPWANWFTKAKLLDTIANPPKALLEKVEEMRQQLMDEVSPPTTTRRTCRRNQEWGDELTPESVLSRSLTPWERTTRETEPRRSVTIGVNLSLSAQRRAEHLLWRGAAAAALADILTQRGMNVQIIAFVSATRMSTASRHVVARYVVKQADMPLDVGAAAVALAEIAYARLVAIYGLTRHMDGTLDDGLGHPEPLPRQDCAGIDYLAEEYILDRERAVDWLKAAATQTESEVLHV